MIQNLCFAQPVVITRQMRVTSVTGLSLMIVCLKCCCHLYSYERNIANTTLNLIFFIRTSCNHFSSLQVVNVYEIIKRQLVHKKSLYGHSDGITCLAASSAYGLLVSGSRDRSAIIWDLARKAFVRQLIPHEAPVAALAINEQTVSLWQQGHVWK